MKNLKEMQAEVKSTNEANGWFDSSRTFGDDIALLHSEVSEAFEAYREHGTSDYSQITYSVWNHPDSYRLGSMSALRKVENATGRDYLTGDILLTSEDPTPEPFTLEELHDLAADGISKPEGVGSELADILIRLLDTAERYDIDLDYEFDRKIAYNKTREFRHGNKRV